MTADLLTVPLEEVRKTIERKYRALWTKVFGGHEGLSPAVLDVSPVAGHAGYRPDHNVLMVGISPYDLSDPAVLVPESDPTWLSDLVHEMVHEYQSKVIAGDATEEGRALRTRFAPLYPQPGHDETYFSGVPLFADLVGKPIKEFVEWIAPFPFG